MRLIVDGVEIKVQNDVRIIHESGYYKNDVHLVHNSEGLVVDVVGAATSVGERPVIYSTSMMVESLGEMAEIASEPPDEEPGPLGVDDIGAIDFNDLPEDKG